MKNSRLSRVSTPTPATPSTSTTMAATAVRLGLKRSSMRPASQAPTPDSTTISTP